MNANELIDLLHTEDVQFSQQALNGWAEKAIAMLRQQQAEIEELKILFDKTLNNWAKDMERNK